MIFVFGSNLAGIHGAGAARYAALNLGAERGVGRGRTGQCYALPTKGSRIQCMPIGFIKQSVDAFLNHAAAHPEDKFKVTRVACGLGGYKDEDIAPLFENAPNNCYFDTAWAPLLTKADKRNFWGTM